MQVWLKINTLLLVKLTILFIFVIATVSFISTGSFIDKMEANIDHLKKTYGLSESNVVVYNVGMKETKIVEISAATGEKILQEKIKSWKRDGWDTIDIDKSGAKKFYS